MMYCALWLEILWYACYVPKTDKFLMGLKKDDWESYCGGFSKLRC